MLIADITPQAPMTKRFLIAIFHRLYEYLLPFIVQKTFVKFLIEMLGTQSMLVKYLENDTVNNNRLKNLRDVETQRVASLAWCMQETDSWIELSLMNSL